ncbi:NUDIX domain-containing protein, partial [Candidatus Woesearchaeota archaeon]|nr:NUDIX domain-containing protein [Candidatus Woesearchaeota archaeon]
MAKEVSVGAIVYKKNKKIEYLLLHKLAHKQYKELWGFPRGNVDKGEKQIDTAKREIKEETGLTKLRFDEKFKEKIQFFYRKEGETIFKEVVYYLAELTEGEVKISDEHSGYRWCSFETAMKTLTYNNSKNVLEKANKF